MSLFNFHDFIKHISPEPLHVLDPTISRDSYCKIDLSIDNDALLKVNTASSTELGNFIFSEIKASQSKVGIGGYLEVRTIYDRSTYFNEVSEERKRNIHLGLDLWIEAGTKIYSPLDAQVHSFNNNTNHGDYGPTIILYHQVNNVSFYTLYGHLSLESLSDLEVGKKINKGECFASLGNSDVNGDYPPHLHFQIIKELQGNFGDYPGVSSNGDLNYYLNNCPDPNLLLKIESVRPIS